MKILRFGKFEFDLEREQLRRSGMLVRLSPQPTRLLGLFLRRPGEVVTREEIREHLWPEGTWVDYEQGINHGIRRIRTVLGDDAATSRYVETLPRTGYRFFAGVETVDGTKEDGNGNPPVSVPAPRVRRAPRVGGILAASLLVGSVLALGVGLARRAPDSLGGAFDQIQLQQLTSRGDLWSAALSPNGRYVAYSLHEDGGWVVRLRSIDSRSDLRLVEPQETPIPTVGFSLDGTQVYYRRQATLGPGYSALFAVGVQGGPARQLLFDVDSGTASSPDGGRLGFIRGYPSRGETALIVAEAQDGEEHTLATWSAPETLLPVSPAWSPDGRRLAVAVRTARADAAVDVRVVEADSGEIRPLGGVHWDQVRGLGWLADGSGLLLVAEETGAEDRPQIWQIVYPTGEARRVSNDLGSYRGLSLNAATDALVSIQVQSTRSLWSFDRSCSEECRDERWSHRNEPNTHIVAVRRGPDRGMLFTAQHADRTGLWRISGPNAQPEPLLPEMAPDVRGFAVSPDAESVVYEAAGPDGIPHLWSLPARGGSPRLWTDGGGEFAPSVCTGGAPVLYRRQGAQGLWAIDRPGGVPRLVTSLTPYSNAPVCSPDGTRIAFDTNLRVGEWFQRTLVVVPSQGGPPTHRIHWPDGRLLAWDPGGEALTYAAPADWAPAVWRLPLDGGEAQVVRTFRGGTIFSFDWSADGTRLLGSHGHVRSNAVLISQAR